jgi:hypothetical protein
MLRVHGVIPKILCFDGAKGAEAYVESDKGMGKLTKEFGCEVKAGGWCGNGAWGLGIGGLVVDGVGGLEIGLALSFPRFEDVGRKGRQTVLFQIQRVTEDFENQLASGNRFLDSELGGGSGRGDTRDGIGKNDGSWLESLRGSAEGGPPTWTGFFKKQEFGPIL